MADGTLLNEVHFVEGARATLVAVAKAATFLIQNLTREARSVSQDGAVALVKSVRAESFHFSNLLSTLGLDVTQLFSATPTRLLQHTVGLLDAARVARRVRDAVAEVLGVFAKGWTADITEASTTIASWCPAWQPFVGKLMAKEKESIAMVLALVKNPKYGDLEAASNTLRLLVARVKNIHRDKCASFMVDVQLLSDASHTAELAAATTVMTYILFRLRVEIPKLTNATAAAREKEEVATFIRTHKLVDVGADVREAAGVNEQESVPQVAATPKKEKEPPAAEQEPDPCDLQ